MRTALVLALLATPLPALAQDAPAPPARTFQVPQGCEAYLTVQMTGCTVSHHFTCEADPEGWQRRVDMDEGGVAYFGAVDAETQWVESNHVLSEHSERLAPDPVDPASFSTLISTSLDTFDFGTLSDEVGPTRYVGEDRLTGDTVTIDGVTLDVTEYSIEAFTPNGKLVWSGEGREFISRDWRMFLSGTSAITAGGETTESDSTPVEFVMPGEPGFLSVSPKHGCGAVMSKAAAP